MHEQCSNAVCTKLTHGIGFILDDSTAKSCWVSASIRLSTVTLCAAAAAAYCDGGLLDSQNN